ncbi:hypothetical protein PGTUg99_015687 [Puccinia graminis f. sp. tritici]|uniref:Uncharacterized protein n=1 Tax=Puccinia graminis f. sp. tritici TaxID=56615 RepID=A0A5B0RZ21_PUCGR|nr:hypothetical protein PGTUg99_015687 [Puccinia graminis f. sp. tritici]
MAVQRRHETNTILSELLGKPNPHHQNRTNFTINFFKAQWASQKDFRANHTAAEDGRKSRLVALYKRQSALQEMRERLQEAPNHVENRDAAVQLMDSILENMSIVSQELDELTRSGAFNVPDPEEQRLRLLLWDAKAELYVQAVQLCAESQPLRDSHIMGSHLGTEGKERIFKAMRNRRPAVKKLLDAFNTQYQEFKLKYPNQNVSDSHPHPLTYEVFSSWPLDHQFWNDSLYYHSDEPWSIDPDVRAGINCILVLNRVQEEFELIAQELARAIGWAIEYYNQVSDKIQSIASCMQVINDQGEVREDFINNLPMDGMNAVEKYRVIGDELRARLALHAVVVEEWSDDIIWLWDRCQPINNRGHISQWHDLLAEVKRNQPPTLPESPDIHTTLQDIDDGLEEIIINGHLDDGEDAEENLMTDDDHMSNTT